MRWIVRVMLAAIAVIAVCAQLDRASYLKPQLSVVVPKPFRSFAQPTLALIALAGGDTASAEIEARRLVRRRPMPAEHLFTLAMADLRSGRPAAFAATFRAASTRGWRYAPLQVTAAQAALASGDLAGAANRIAALWAENPTHPSSVPLTRQLLAMKGGPEAFAIPLANTHVWSSNFVRRAASLAPPANTVKTVAAARRAGADFDCRALKVLASAYAKRGEQVASSELTCK
ncbi:hypothetical protein GCM10011515_21640 [Tsuneonella deserti]|uniref:Tetratricopeptide repeat protein n=2 Tax=Tsuneonella deserti TaxID=2035528 RepID=A0ABQ1SBG4_9SPHN|nr:hypothetical protein GCM10011515_21640 [Tsuneonella deserti]